MAYASVDDLEMRWRELDEHDKVRAEALLDDAAVKIDSEWARFGIVPTEKLKRAALAVSCSMVGRAMSAPNDIWGATQTSQTAGVYTVSSSSSLGFGNLYFTKEERVQLGIQTNASQKVCFIPCMDRDER